MGLLMWGLGGDVMDNVDMMPYVAMGAMGVILVGLVALVLGIWIGIRIEDRWDIQSRGYNFRRSRGSKTK